MIHALAIKAAEYLIKNEVGKEECHESYVYGLEIIMEKLITYSVLLFLALHIKLLIPSILFVIFFVILRGYTGGLHANTYMGCFTGTIVMYLTCSQLIAPFLIKEKIIIYLSLFIAGTLIFLLAPINHPNLNMNFDEIKKCKRGIRFVLAFEIIFIVGGVFWEVNEVYIVFPCLGLVMCAILLILAKIIKQEVKVHEEKH